MNLTPEQTEQISNLVSRYAENEVLANQDFLVREALKKSFFKYDDINEPRSRQNEEVCEWYLVSSWLVGKLEEAEAITLQNDCGNFWGRTETGQNLRYVGLTQKCCL